ENELGKLEPTGLGSHVYALDLAIGRVAMPERAAAQGFAIAPRHEEMDICRGQRLDIDKVIAFRGIEAVKHLVEIADELRHIRRARILTPYLDLVRIHGWKACSPVCARPRISACTSCVPS